MLAETLIEMTEIADAAQVGAVLGRRLDDLVVRSQPSEVGEQ
jgi:hypothetical protein